MAKKKNGKRFSVKNRIISIVLIFAIATVVVMGRMFYLQVIASDELQEQAYQLQTRGREVTAKRGDILDRNHKVMATSAEVVLISISPENIRESCGDDIDKRAGELAKLLDLKKKDVKEKFLKENSSYEVIKRQVSNSLASKVNEWAQDADVKGIYMEEDTKRYYPNGNLASHILGFTGTDNQGLNGIESVMDKYLTGNPGRIVTAADAGNTELPFSDKEYFDASEGYNVTLTIDATIQHYAENELAKAIKNNKALNGGVAIVMDPNTGDILAMTSQPDYNPNKPFDRPSTVEASDWNKMTDSQKSEQLNKSWRNKALNETYEPGSTFKAITTTAALEEGVVRRDTVTNDSPVDIDEWTIECWREILHGTETFEEGVRNSCNPVFVKASLLLGIKRFYSYVRAFGFYDNTGIELPGEAESIIHSDPLIIDMATASFGQRFQVTPIQVITAYAAIANGGKLLKPQIIEEVTDSQGDVVKKYDTEVIRNVASESTIKEVRDILEGVVSKGTGKNAYIMGYKVAGKSGTSETLETETEERYIASFSAFAPADDPEVCVLVVLDFPTGPYGHQGGSVAAPVVKAILEDTLTYLGVQPKYTKEERQQLQEDIYVPNIVGKKLSDAKNLIEAAGLYFEMEGLTNGNDVKVKEQIPKAGAKVKKRSTVIAYAGKSNDSAVVSVPNVVGMSEEQATSTLSAVGLNISKTGNGVAVKQQYPAGTQVKKGQMITVEFRYLDVE